MNKQITVDTSKWEIRYVGEIPHCPKYPRHKLVRGTRLRHPSHIGLIQQAYRFEGKGLINLTNLPAKWMYGCVRLGLALRRLRRMTRR